VQLRVRLLDVGLGLRQHHCRAGDYVLVTDRQLLLSFSVPTAAAVRPGRARKKRSSL
jgi:hypothetical protein